MRTFAGHDYFTNNVPRWEKLVKPHLLSVKSQTPKALDIAPGNGLSTLWLLENIPNIHVTVVHTDTKSYPAFCKNLRGHAKRLTVHRCDDMASLRHVMTHDMKREYFDFVYIDLDTDGRFTMETSVYVFDLMKPRAMCIFDDYTTDVHSRPGICPKFAIDAFVSVYSAYLKVISVSWQLVYLKRSKPLYQPHCRSQEYHEDISKI